MKKEKLLEKKKTIKDSMIWHVRNTITDDEIRMFSLSQLLKMCEIFERAEKYREGLTPFYTLSATELLHKESGKIAEFVQDSEYNYVAVKEKSEEAILNGASRSIYMEYKNLTENK